MLLGVKGIATRSKDATSNKRETPKIMFALDRSGAWRKRRKVRTFRPVMLEGWIEAIGFLCMCLDSVALCF